MDQMLLSSMNTFHMIRSKWGAFDFELDFNLFFFSTKIRKMSLEHRSSKERSFNFDYELRFAAHPETTWLD